MLGIEQIQEILPQRFPFLLIDRVIEMEAGTKVVAIKNVTINEGFFSGHFPAQPVMPGVLIIEAMAQAAIVLFYSKLSSAQAQGRKLSYYLGYVKVRFFHPVFPGDQLKLTVKSRKTISSAAIVGVSACVGDKEVASGELAISAKENSL